MLTEINEIKQVKSPFKYIMESQPGTETYINGKKYLYFAGAGYYQLQTNPEVIKAATDSTLKYGIGSATSRAITGTTDLLLKLEQRIAEFFNTEDAAYLPSGYLTNIAGIQALNKMNVFDKIFIDEGSHYCNIEGAFISGKSVIKFKHRDSNDLQQKIETHLQKNEKPLIASDGMFPIWAKLAPVDKYLEIAEKHDGVVWIDDAHPVGILGEKGRGTYEHFKLNSKRLYMGATLSKAFGAYGGIIPGSSEFIKHVKTGNVMIGSSSPMNAAVAAGLKGLDIVKNNPQMREKLWENARFLKKGLKSIGILVDDNDFPIVAFIIGNSDRMQRIHNSLMNKGVYIQYTNYLGAGTNGVLRIVVSSSHLKNQIQYLIDCLKELV